MTEAVELHLRRFFRGHPRVHFQTWPGPIASSLPDFRVMVIPPGPRTCLWTYASLGAYAIRTGEHANEFFVLAAESSEAHVELVTMVAHYHADADPSYRLGHGHTVSIGRPWLPGSRCDQVLLCRPYPFGPELEHCADPRGHVQVLWLLPITQREREFQIVHGLEALEQRFESAGLEYWRPDRGSLV